MIDKYEDAVRTSHNRFAFLLTKHRDFLLSIPLKECGQYSEFEELRRLRPPLQRSTSKRTPDKPQRAFTAVSEWGTFYQDSKEYRDAIKQAAARHWRGNRAARGRAAMALFFFDLERDAIGGAKVFNDKLEDARRFARLIAASADEVATATDRE